MNSNVLGVGDFWINLVSLAIALLGVSFGIWVYFKSKQRRLITYEFEDENTNVVSVDRDLGEDIQIYMYGQQVEEVRYQLIKIRNEGNMAVDDEDYRNPLQIVFTPRTVSNTNQSSQIILRAGIPEAASSLGISSHNARDYIILNAQKHYVALKDVLLNPRDWIKVKVLTLGKVNIGVRGQIRNGMIKPFVPTQILLTRRKVGYALLGALLFFLLYNSIGLITAFVQGSCVSGSIQVGGSSAFFDTANGYANKYHAVCPIGLVHVERNTSTTGLSDLASGTIQIANSEVPNSNPSSADLEDHQVAVIPFVIVINKDVTGISSLTPDQLLKIYNGTYRNWNEVDSRASNIPIQVFGRPTTSGTHYTFTRYVLSGTEAHSAPSYQEKDTTDQVAQAVAQTSGAIGYVDEETAGKMTSVISSVEINGQAPTYASIEHNDYSFWAIEHMYTRKNPDSLTASFITYVIDHIQTGDAFIKIQDMPASTLQAHT